MTKPNLFVSLYVFEVRSLLHAHASRYEETQEAHINLKNDFGTASKRNCSNRLPLLKNPSAKF